jgi:hypothetical protein
MTFSFSMMRAGLAAILLGFTVSACGYNTIPTAEEQAKAKWADVQNNYQRRADLIPNLVATVQGYAKQEREVLTAVVEARAKAQPLAVTKALVGAFETSDKRTRVVITATSPEGQFPTQEICNIVIDNDEAAELMSALKFLFQSIRP